MDTDEFTSEDLNFFRTIYLTANVIPDGLRQVFKQQWDVRYRSTHGEWNNTAKNGADFYSLTTPHERNTKAREVTIIRNGNSSEWDCTCLVYAIIYSNCIGKKSLDLNVKKCANDLRIYRNRFVHAHHGKITNADFQASIQVVINAFRDLNLNIDVIQTIKTQTSFETKELKEIRKELEKEKERNEEPQTFCDLPLEPSHVAVLRQSEVNSIIQEMERLQSLHPNEVTHVYLSGNPGCGKSETARQVGEHIFKNISSESYKTFVATLNASSIDALLNSYIDLARLLRFNEDYIQSIVSSKTCSLAEDKILQLIGLVKQKIRMFSSWLMIVDNVINLKEMSKFFPRVGQITTGKGQMLVTTQDSLPVPLTTPKIYHVSLSEGMKIDEAVTALRSISGQTQEDAPLLNEVAEVLDLQPLALACAAFYVHLVNKRHALSWKEFLSKIQKGNHEFQNAYLQSSGQVYPQSMKTAVKMAVDRVIEEKDEIMICVFQFLSLLANDPVPTKYVVQYVLNCMPGKDEYLIEDHILGSSLVRTSRDTQDIRVHQVVQNVIQESVRHDDCLTLTKVMESFSSPDVSDHEVPDYSFITCTRSLIPHLLVLQEKIHTNIQSIASSNMMTKEQALAFAKCMSCCIGKILHLNGEIKAAKTCYEASILIKETVCTATDVTVLIEHNKLGEVLIDLKEFKEARVHTEKALTGDFCLKEDQELYFRVLSNHGVALSYLGDLKEAEECLKKAILLIPKVKDSPYLGQMLNNLTVMYVRIGKYAEAKVYIEKALDIDRERYGENHPYLTLRYNDLAVVLQNMGKYNEAKEYLEKAITIELQCFGENHPYLSILNTNLGRVLRDLKQYEEAKECIERAIAIAKLLYNDNHPVLAAHLHNLGLVLRDLAKYEEAKKHMERAVAIDEQAYGNNHPVLAKHLNNLGLVLRDLRQYEEAKKFMERAVAIDEHVYHDDNHPAIAMHLNNLGLVLRDLEQYEEAKQCMEKAVAIGKQVYDDNHPCMVTYVKDLDLLLRDLKQYEKAKQCCTVS